MTNPFVYEAMRDLLGSNIDDLVSQLDQLADTDTSQLDQFSSLATLFRNITDCIKLDRFEPLATEEDVLNRMKSLSLSNKALAG